MIKTILFDADGMVIRSEMPFSQRFSKEFGIPMEEISPFFENEFKLCLIGKADLKEELKKYLSIWNWKKSVEDLMEYWFLNESTIDKKMLEIVKSLDRKGINCYLDTNNEKYRVDYIFNNLGLRNNFKGIFSSADIGYKKPEVEFWVMVHNRLGKPNKSEVMVWDDSEKNIESAKKFGFSSEFYSNFNYFSNHIEELTL